MTKIFISYRRQDTKQIAGRIFDRLEAKFGRDALFMDIDTIPFGVDFHDHLSEAVGRAEIVLALIGHGWADARDEAGRRRLDNPDDFVRIEIEAAVRRKIWLGAVLIDGAPLPRPEQLPEGMRALTRRNAAFVDVGRDFHAHMDRLIGDLERLLNGPASPANSEAARRRAEGRIQIEAAIVSNLHGRWFLPGAGKTEWFRDFDAGPEMVVVPAGSFTMGSPEDEPGRLHNESPQRTVTIARPFAIGRHAVTRGQFAAFANATEHKTDGGAYVWNGKEWTLDPAKSWRNPGFAQDDRHPVVCVNWQDAQAYVTWLNQKTGKAYRLPSEAEWEYVCRAGTVTPFWWGSSIATDQANYDGTADVYEGGGKTGEWRRKTVQAESFAANPWGLYQVHGNVLEWTADCWNATYEGAPMDGSARTTGDCSLRVLRGGSWNNHPRSLRAAGRIRDKLDIRVDSVGFRLSRAINP